MRTTYHPLSVLWHWVIALALALAYVFIFARPEGISPESIKLMNYHKWAGATVLIFSVLRILTRLVFAAPPMGADVRMPGWQMGVHKLVLLLMLVLTLAVPLGGWLMSSAAGIPVVYLGVLPLPDLVAPNPELAQKISFVHVNAGFALLALAVLHTLAALKHFVIDGDSVLRRMVPFLPLKK